MGNVISQQQFLVNKDEGAGCSIVGMALNLGSCFYGLLVDLDPSETCIAITKCGSLQLKKGMLQLLMSAIRVITCAGTILKRLSVVSPLLNNTALVD